MRNPKMILLVCVLFLAACSSKPPESATSEPGAAPAATPSGASATPAGGSGAAKSSAGRSSSSRAAAPAAAPVTVPAGHAILVRLDQTVGSKASSTGDSFTATVSEPVEVDGKVVIPQGATATGTVADAAPLGRFKGGARLRIVLNSINVNGKEVKVETAAAGFSQKGKGKRSAAMIGGGAGLGAIVGALAGGGKGAAIGAAAGAGAGTAGAAFTGNKEIVLPAETAVSFKLLQPVEIQQ